MATNQSKPVFLQDVFYVHFYNYVGFKLTQSLFVQGELTDEEKPWEDWMMNGFNSYGEGPYINKPNATVLKVPEGMIIETGKPFTKAEFDRFAENYLGADIIFWSTASPWLKAK